jgi:hypothetical protein
VRITAAGEWHHGLGEHNSEGRSAHGPSSSPSPQDDSLRSLASSKFPREAICRKMLLGRSWKLVPSGSVGHSPQGNRSLRSSLKFPPEGARTASNTGVGGVSKASPPHRLRRNAVESPAPRTCQLAKTVRKTATFFEFFSPPTQVPPRLRSAHESTPVNRLGDDLPAPPPRFPARQSHRTSVPRRILHTPPSGVLPGPRDLTRPRLRQRSRIPTPMRCRRSLHRRLRRRGF